MKYIYNTKGTCCRQIEFEINNNIVSNINFIGGCPGNTQAIAKLLDGTTVEYIEEKLLGNLCGMKTTSCADQLAKAVRLAYNENKNK